MQCSSRSVDHPSIERKCFFTLAFPLTLIKLSQGPILANEIVIVETALNPGNWEVFWYAELDTAGTDPLNPQNATENEVVVTRPSVKVSFEVVGR